MSCKTKISAIVRLFSVVIISLLPAVILAQTPKVFCKDMNDVGFFRYVYNYKTAEDNDIKNRPINSFSVCVRYADGTTKDLSDLVSSSTSEGVFYKDVATVMGKSMLRNLVVYYDRLPAEYYGQTIEVSFDVGSGANQITKTYQFEYLGFPGLFYNPAASSNFEFGAGVYGEDVYKFPVCKDDAFTISIDASNDPYAGAVNSYLGHTYETTYYWTLSDFQGYDEYQSENYRTGSTITLTDMTNGEMSNIYTFTPKVKIGDGCIIFLNDTYQYEVYYTAPITTKVKHNGVEGTSFVVCDGDEVSVDLSFFRDGNEYSDVWVSLESSNNKNTEKVIYDPVDGSAVQTINLGTLSAVNGENTTYTFSYTTKDIDEFGAECEETGLFTILVKERQAQITINPIADICEGGTIYPTATVEGKTYSDYTFSWKYGSTEFATGVSGSYTFADGISGDQTLSFTVSNDGCDITETTTVYVNARPVITPSADVEICYGESTTLEAISNTPAESKHEASAGTTFTWSPAGGTESTTGDKSTYTVAPTTTTTYTIIGKNNDTGCTSKEASVTVTVNPLPYVTKIDPSSWTLCQKDQSVTLQASTAGGTGSFTYKWSWSDDDGSHSETTTIPTLTINSINASTPVKIYLKLIDEKGCNSSVDPDFNITLTMSPKPTVNVDDFTMCDGTTGSGVITDYDASNTYSVSAVTSGAPAASITSGVCYVNSNLGITAETKYTYRVKVTTGNGCSTEKDFDVTISPMPNITAASDKSLYCVGESVKLTASSTTPNVSYSWRDNADNEIATTANKTLSSLTVGNYSYTLVITNKTTGCQSKKTVTFSVVDVPVKPIITATPDVICSGDASKSTTLTVTNAESGVTYSWYNQANTLVGSGNSLTLTPTATTTYYAVGKNANECLSVKSETVTVNYYESPVISASKTTFDVCKNSSQTLTVTTSSTGTLVYHWSDGAETTTGTHEVTPSATTTYSVYAEDQTTHCTSNTINFTVNVYSIGDITIAPAAQNVCIGNEATIKVTVTPWTEDAYHVLAINEYDANNIVKHSYPLHSGVDKSFTVNADRSYGVYLYVINGTAECEDWLDAGITMFEEPDFTISGDTETCVGGSLTLSPNVTNPLATYTYQWYHGSTLVGTTETLTLSNVTAADAGEYSLTISAPAANCSTTKSVNVVVNALPVPTIDSKDQICSSGSTTIKTTTNYASYVWNVNGGSDVTASTLTLNGDDYAPGSTVNIKVVVTDAKGCVSAPVTNNVYVKQEVVITDANNTKDLACIGSSVTLSPTVTPVATYTYDWSESTGKIDLSGKHTASITIDDLAYPTSGSTYTVTVTATDADNCSASFDYTINMYKVEVAVDGSTNACNNTTESISWTATASVNPTIAATYKYDFALYNSANTVVYSIADQTSNVYTLTASQVQALAEGKYTIVATAHANIGGGSVCEGTSEAFDLTIYAKPDATLSSNMPTCIGDEIAFTAVAGYDSYEFRVNGTAVQSGSKNVFKSSSLNAGDVVTVTVASSTCQETSEPSTVSYLAEFAPTYTVDNTVVCKGSSATINVTSTTQKISHVKVLRDGVAIVDEDITPALTYKYVCDNVVADTEIRLEYTSENNCAASSEYTVKVYKVDVDVTGSTTTCNNTTSPVSWSAAVTPVPVAADSYTYDFALYDATNTALFSVTGQTSEDFILSASDVQTLAEGNYKIVATAHANFGGTTCDGTSTAFNLKVLAKPDNSLDSNMPTCIGDAITFTAVAGYDLYVFYVNDVIAQSNASNTFTSTDLAEGDKVYVKITSASCEEISETKIVSYLPEFNPTVSVDKTLICKGTSATFTCITSTQLIANVDVYVNDVKADSQTLSPNATSFAWVTSTLDSDARVRFEFTSENGCKASSAETTIEVSQMNIGTIDGASTSCRDGSATYTISGTSVMHGAIDNFVANPSDYTYSYELTIDGVAQPNPTSTTSTVDLNFATAGEYKLTATLTEVSTGCTSSTTKTINVVELPSFTVTSSYTKAGDGKYYVCSDQNFDLAVIGGMTGDRLNLESATHGKLTFDVNVAASLTTTDDKVVIAADGSGKYLFTYADDAKNVDDTWSITLEGGTTDCVSEVTTITVHNYAPIEISVPAPYVISGNTLQLCLGNTATISATSLSDDATPTYNFSLDGGAAVAGTSFDVTGTTIGTHTLTVTHENGCSVELTIVTLNAPNPDATVEIYNAETDSYNAAPFSTSYYEVCSSDVLKLTATGASAYTLSVDRDGVDVTSMFTSSSSDATFAQSLSLPYDEASAGGKDYSTYTLTYSMSVGTCYDSKVVVVRSYVMPDITLTASATTAIEGDDIIFTVTPNTYAKYEFYLNNTKVSTDDTQATYTLSNIQTDTTMVVVVTNAYGCSVTKEISVVVLDEILPRDVLTSADYYCEGSGPITISVSNPQPGVTYVLNNCASCAPIECTAANPNVEWNVFIDAGTPIPGVNGVSQTYNVTAYYTQLPGLVIDMNNSVTISEYVMPQAIAITPYNQTYSDCYVSDARIIRVPNSEVNVRYYLMYDADFDGDYDMEMGPIKGNGSILDFKVADKVGQYKVVAYQFDINNGGLLCPVDLDGYVKVELPNLTTFTAYSDPANGNFCSTGDGVNIVLNGSEVGVTYYLMKDNDYIISGADTAKLAGTGSSITFENIKVAGTYSVISLNKGCLVPMEGSVDLTEYAAPIDYDFSATHDGFFCSNAPGVELSVAGQQDGYLYTLYRNGIEILSVLGDNSGTSLLLSDTITVAANYNVRVSIPSVVGGCDLWLSDTVTVTSKEPSDIVSIALGDDAVSELVVCEGETVNLRLFGTKPDARYQLTYVTPTGLQLTYGVMQTATDNYLDFSIDQAVGAVEFGVISETDYFNKDGIRVLTCELTSTRRAKLVVVNGVNAGGEIVSHETPADVTDECYGEDIIITGAQSQYQVDDVVVDYKYTLYRYENLTGDNNTGNTANYSQVSMNNSPFVATGDPAHDRFLNIKNNNGTYMIQVSNGYCSAWLPNIINITSDKFVTQQNVIVDKEVCHGDPGSIVTLAATEVGVTYTLMKAVGTVGDDDDIQLGVAYTAVNTDPYVFADADNNPIRVSQTGTYYVIGVNSNSATPCPTPMGDFNFVSHALPKSYQLVGKENYCGSETGVQLSLSSSDVNTTYTLYKVVETSADPELLPISSVIGTGGEITFPEVSAGIYTATSINKYGCTSSMDGVIEVTNSPVISPVYAMSDAVVCDGQYTFIYEAANMVPGLTYYLVKGSASPEVVDTAVVAYMQFKATSPDFVQNLTESGLYTVWASYDYFACVQQIDQFNLSVNNIKVHNLLAADDKCDGKFTVYLENVDAGVDYDVEFVLKNGVVSPRQSLELDDNNKYSATYLNGVDVDYAVAYATTPSGCNVPMADTVYAHVNAEIADPVDATLADLTICDGGSATFTYASANMMKGVTYYLVRGNNAPNANSAAIVDTIVADGVRDFEVEIVADGTYTIWASYDAYNCLQYQNIFNVVAETATKHYIKPIAGSCDGTVVVALDGTEAGIKYLIDITLKDGVVERDTLDATGSYTYLNGANVDFVSVYALTANGCEIPMDVNVPVTDIYDGSVIARVGKTSDITICSGAAAQFTYDAANMLPNLTYYLMKGNVSPIADATAIVAQHTADGANMEKVLTSGGIYTIWASFDSYSCMQPIDTFNVVMMDVVKNRNVNTVASCDGSMKIELDGHDDDITYKAYFYLNDGSVEVHELVDGIYVYQDAANVDHAAVYALSASCDSVQMGADVTPKFVEAVTGELAFFLNGTEVTEKAAEVCIGSSVSLIGTASVAADNYIFKFVTQTVDTATASLVDKVIMTKTSKSNIFMPKSYELESLGENSNYGNVTVILGVEAGECGADSVASFKFSIINPVMSEQRLFAKADTTEMRKVRFESDTVHVHYCEGDFGVKLFYSRAVKNEIYRLYKQADSTMVADEIQDIQEVPMYSDYDVISELYFDGWGFNAGDSLNYADAGTYYVEFYNETTGCTQRTNTITIVMDPSPIDTTNNVYYMFISDDGKGEWHLDTKNENYGLIGGSVVLENPKAGVTYELVCAELGDQALQRKTIVDADLYHNLVKGSAVPSIHFDTISVEGTYMIRAIDDITGCDDYPGTVEFVEDELITYDVFLFLGKDDNVIYKNLVPNLGSKGNHKYLDWSSKIDVVWQPVINDTLKTQGAPEMREVEDDEYEKYVADSRGNKTGYTAFANKANIEFYFAPVTKVLKTVKSVDQVSDSTLVTSYTYYTTLVDTVSVDLNAEYAEGCDSVQLDNGTYQYYTPLTGVEKSTILSVAYDTVSNKYSASIEEIIKNKLAEYALGCDSDKVVRYTYFTKNDTTWNTSVVRDSIYGEYGFYNLETLDLEKTSSKSGWFKYTRRPRFYGTETIPYYAVNKLMPSIRRSNTSHIYVHCGNEDTGIEGVTFTLPNAFSPNGDGLNDTYKIVMPGNMTFDNTRLKVYNRWGTLVYESSGTQYGVDCPFWDGTSTTSNMVTVGSHLPSGTYFYVFQIDFIDESSGLTAHKELHGYIELRR